MAKLRDKLEFALICGSNKATWRLRARRNGPYVEFRRTIKKREPSRNQMILKEEVCGTDVLKKAAFALKNKGIHYYVQKSDENNARTIVVECGRDFDLAYACAYTVLTDVFGIPPDGYFLQKDIGRFSPDGIGFGHVNEIAVYGVDIKVDELLSVVEDLKNSRDKNAFVSFGWRGRELPNLMKEIDEDGKFHFVLEYPVFNQRETDVISKLQERGVELKKVDHTVLIHILKNPENWQYIARLKEKALSRQVLKYLIPLGTDTNTVTEKLKQILLDSGLYYGIASNPEKKVKYRLSEFITTEWKPQGGAYNERPWAVKIDAELRRRYKNTGHPAG